MHFKAIEYARLELHGLNKTGKIIKNDTLACLANLPGFLKGPGKIVKTIHKIRRNVELSDVDCITYLTAWSRLWHFGKFFTNPVEIVKRDEFTWDVRKITGFELYTGVAVLRQMQENPNFVYQHKDLDLSLSTAKLGLEIIKLIYPFCDKIYGNFLPTVGQGHHFFKIIKKPQNPNSFKFGGLIKVPEQASVSENKGWCYALNNQKFNCFDYFVPENTRDDDEEKAADLPV